MELSENIDMDELHRLDNSHDEFLRITDRCKLYFSLFAQFNVEIKDIFKVVCPSNKVTFCQNHLEHITSASVVELYKSVPIFMTTAPVVEPYNSVTTFIATDSADLTTADLYDMLLKEKYIDFITA